MSSVIHSIGPRLHNLLHEWNRRLIRDFKWYAQARLQGKKKNGEHRVRPNLESYWLVVPEQLAAAFRQANNSPPLSRQFLKDAMWGQYCLFLTVKIHDDLYDRHVDRPSLMWAGDAFLLEAQRVYAFHFGPNSRFWEFYHRSIRTTIRAIQDIERLQTRPPSRPRESHRQYAALNAVFKIAAHAVCAKAHRMRYFRGVSDFYDHLAIVGQMTDDFEDIFDDFQHGRINSVATFLLRAGGPSRKKPLERMAYNLLYTDVSQKIFRRFHRYLNKAEKAAGSLRIPGLSEYVHSYRDSIRLHAERVHAQRVRLLFGKIRT